MNQTTYLLFFCALMFSCKSTNNKNSSLEVNKIVQNEIGEPTSSDQNEDGTYTIFRKEKEQNTNLPQIEYIIIENSSSRIIKKGFISMGSIEWMDNSSVKIVDLPRVMPEGKTMDDFISIINLNRP